MADGGVSAYRMQNIGKKHGNENGKTKFSLSFSLDAQLSLSLPNLDHDFSESIVSEE